MAQNRAVIVWDIGKSSAKLCAIRTPTGEVAAERSRPLASLSGPPYTHLDTEGLWSWALGQLRELGEEFEVDAIVVTAHGATAALIDDDHLVLPVLDYEDLSPAECESEYASLRPAFAESYSPVLSGSLNFGRGVFWQSRKFAQHFGRARHLLTYAQYWSWRLSGIPAVEVSSLGSHSDMWCPAERRYSSLVEQLGWQHLLPPLRSAREVLGPLRPEVAKQAGLPPQCKVYCGIHDSNASLVPWLDRRQPFTVVSSGTWVIVFAVGTDLSSLDPSQGCTANVTIDGTPVACSRWMGGREYSNMAGGHTATADDMLACLDAGAMFMPAQGGQSGPFGEAKGSAPDPKSPPGILAAAASFYCALVLDHCLDLCNSQGPLIIEGPFSRNEHLAASLAVFRSDQSVELSADPTGTTAGAARMAIPDLPAPRVDAVVPFAAADRLLDYRSKWRKRLENGGC